MAEITEKQVNFLNMLLKSNNKTLKIDVNQLDKFIASKLIGYLKSNCNPVDEELEKQFVSNESCEMPQDILETDNDETLPF